ncbi:site-specific integrase [uncultured Clostridium sp.]|uniref:tyrosine-type recombinase/integrase n=1 Tax=uncultured Clostridium sp. TaxID=59620 RepID=UPI0028E3DD38|nr:site-specific integrase [uncultured Clostridium sp.]
MKGTVKKEGPSWGYLVYVGTDENGKKKYKRKRGFKTKKECEAALAELISQLEKGIFVANSKMNVQEFMEYWLDKYPKRNCQPATYKRYQEFSNDIVKYLGKYKLTELKPLIIEDFYDKLIDERKLSNNTVIKIHRMFNLSLKHAQTWQMLIVNPCSLASPPKSTKEEMSYWKADEISFYLDRIKGHRLYNVTFLAAHTGCRVGELCALKWEDIDLVDSILNITKSMQRIKGKLTLKETKTPKSNRTITLFPSTIKFLKELKREHMERKLEHGIDMDYVLCWEDGRPMDPHYVSQKFPKMLAEYNLPKVRFHDLRHTHATLLLKSKTNPKVISERLGHSTVAFTLDTYSHIDVETQRNEVSKAEQFF